MIRNYAPKLCIFCEQEFTPRSPSARQCRDCATTPAVRTTAPPRDSLKRKGCMFPLGHLPQTGSHHSIGLTWPWWDSTGSDNRMV
jgi:hypothetical protein